MNNLFAFNQNKEIIKDLNEIDSLKDFFKDIIDRRYNFWLEKKNDLIDKNLYLTNILNISIKFKNRVNKYNPKNKEEYLLKIDNNITYINQKLVKVNDLIKMINTKLSKNKESINAITNNFIKDNKMKARAESLKLYDTIKNENERNNNIRSILIKYHNKIIQPGINMIVNFI